MKSEIDFIVEKINESYLNIQNIQNNNFPKPKKTCIFFRFLKLKTGHKQ